MKILHVADLHARYEWFDWLAARASEFDLLVIAGDLLDILVGHESPLTQQKWITQWLHNVHTPIMICSGNHDLGYDANAADTQWLTRVARPGRLWVDDQRATIGGLTIAALPWLGPTLPNEPADIVVVHSPPFGTATSFVPAAAMDYGDQNLADQLATTRNRPWLLLCGHVHRPRRWYAETAPGDATRRTWVLNPGCDLQRRTPTHIVIDTVHRVATRVHELRTDVLYLRP